MIRDRVKKLLRIPHAKPKSKPDPLRQIARKRARAEKLLGKVDQLTGLARIVTGRAQAAAHFGVSSRTIGYWQESGMPHGQGIYDLDAVAAWLKESGIQREQSGGPGARAQLLAAQVKLAELKLARLGGELVEIEVARRLFVRHIHEAKAILDQVPDRVLAALPAAAVKEKGRRQTIRRQAAGVVRSACQALSDLLSAPEIEPPKQSDE
jgi:phage terminase Nu1 subunit (DNA packaging protein)